MCKSLFPPSISSRIAAYSALRPHQLPWLTVGEGLQTSIDAQRAEPQEEWLIEWNLRLVFERTAPDHNSGSGVWTYAEKSPNEMIQDERKKWTKTLEFLWMNRATVSIKVQKSSCFYLKVVGRRLHWYNARVPLFRLAKQDVWTAKITTLELITNIFPPIK